MTQEERDNILLYLRSGQEKIIERVENLEKYQKKLIKRADNLEENYRELNQSIAKIEFDHGNKLQVLLDVATTYSQKFEKTGNRIDRCESRLDKHDNQIYYLNSKVQGF